MAQKTTLMEKMKAQTKSFESLSRGGALYVISWFHCMGLWNFASPGLLAAAMGHGSILHKPLLCIFTGTEPPIPDFQHPFFQRLNHFPTANVAVSRDNEPKEVSAANVEQGDATYLPDNFSSSFWDWSGQSGGETLDGENSIRQWHDVYQGGP